MCGRLKLPFTGINIKAHHAIEHDQDSCYSTEYENEHPGERNPSGRASSPLPSKGARGSLARRKQK